MQGPLFALTVHFVKMEKKIKKRFSFLVSLGQQIDNMRVITIFHWLTQWHELIIKYLLLLWIFIKKKNPQKGYIYTFCKIVSFYFHNYMCMKKYFFFDTIDSRIRYFPHSLFILFEVSKITNGTFDSPRCF